MTSEVETIQQRYGIVGREKEIRRGLACLRAGRHLLLEGPVGVGKTVLATALATHLDRQVFRVDGDERYTEQKLTGWFDPPLVIRQGYSSEAFVPGPLVQAMRAEGILFVNELNRMPEAVQNVLLPALDEKMISVPMLGTITCPDGFLAVATQNPREFVGTGHLSEALRDRFELIRLDYQSEDEEVAIVAGNTGETDLELVGRAVAIGRATRRHAAIKRGASVRAAIAMVQIARRLAAPVDLLEAALIALPTRIEVKDEAERDIEEIIGELVESAEKKAPGGSPLTT
ncbi:MAG: AAA family ATPase [Chloroflexota bacterium]